MKRYAIFGVGGCGRGVMPLASEQFKLEVAAGLIELVFVDDQPSSSNINGYRVLNYAQLLIEPAESLHVCIAIADSKVRQKIVQRCLSDGLNFFEVRAANVIQMDDVFLAEGAILCPFVTLTSNIRIGRHFHANLYSYVEHDSIIGDFVTFAPCVKCNGNVVIEDHAYIGAGAIIKQGAPGAPIVIGRGAVVGMGAVVTKSVPPGAVVVGNPAKSLDSR